MTSSAFDDEKAKARKQAAARRGKARADLPEAASMLAGYCGLLLEEFNPRCIAGYCVNKDRAGCFPAIICMCWRR